MATQAIRSRLSVVQDSLQTQLWPVPTVGVVLAAVAGVLLPRLDARLDDNLSANVRSYLFGGGADAARNVLDAIAGSLITVTSLTFSLTVVTLQLASSQFSPRLLRTFSRDGFVHVTLALFLGTFTYALVVLRTIRTDSSGQPAFIPQVSVTIGVLMTLASVLGLVLFLAHLARQIRVETMLKNVHGDASETVQRVLPRAEDRGDSMPVAPHPPADARPMLTGRSGFLVSADEQELLEAACEAGAVVLVESFPGGWLVKDTPLGSCWPVDGSPLDEETLQRLGARVRKAIGAGPERTAAQDIAYGLRQLTDVCTKALSPGINDPTTAVHALGHSSALLCEMVGFRLGPRLLTDGQGRVRVVLERQDLGDLLDLAVAQPRRYGKDAPNVLARLAQLLREVAWRVQDERQRQAVRDQLARLCRTVADQDFDEAEQGELDRLTTQVEHALAGVWTS